METDLRFYRRRANEELSAASRAVTDAARDRRVQLAQNFLERLDAGEGRSICAAWGIPATGVETSDRKRRVAAAMAEVA